MPLAQPFTTWEPQKPPGHKGVYELGRPAPTPSGYVVVYIGSDWVQKRIRDHSRTSKHWSVYRCEVTNSTRRARERERAEQWRFRSRHNKLPYYNKRIG